MYYKINEQLCKSCGLCKYECHIDLKGRNRANPESDDCSECGHCYSICPYSAIESIDEQQTILCADSSPISSFEMKKFLANRRSYRIFRDDDISSEVLQSLIENSVYVPSGGNSHAYEFTIIQDNNIKSALRDEIMSLYEIREKFLKSKFLKSAVYPFTDKQTKAFLKSDIYYERISFLLQKFSKGEDVVFYNAPAAIVIHSKSLFPTPKEDAVLVGYNINLLAETEGIGACFVTIAQYAINTSTKCKRLIGLEADENVHAVLVVGYPAQKYLRVPKRAGKKIRWM